MALDPPIFEIENFLTDAECETIKSMAKAEGTLYVFVYCR